MKVIVAKNAGFCEGVRRAVERVLALADAPARKSSAENAAKSGINGSHTNKCITRYFTLGPLIHNPQFARVLETKGIGEIDSLDDIGNQKDCAVIIRTHGVTRDILKKANELGIALIDATCPQVKALQRRAQMLEKEGYFVVIVGEPKHPEVEAIASYLDNFMIIETPYDAENSIDELKVRLEKTVAGKKTKAVREKIGIISQTTQTSENFKAIAMLLKERFPSADIKSCETICSATKDRQAAAEELAHSVEIMLVVGGKSSGNTRRLFEICKGIVPTHHIETAAEIDTGWFYGKSVVGVTAGASTPQESIDEVVAFCRRI